MNYASVTQQAVTIHSVMIMLTGAGCELGQQAVTIHNVMTMLTGAGCELCQCNTAGSNHSQCDDYGMCQCKSTIGGDKCDICQEGYFQFSENGCM